MVNGTIMAVSCLIFRDIGTNISKYLVCMTGVNVDKPRGSTYYDPPYAWAKYLIIIRYFYLYTEGYR